MPVLPGSFRPTGRMPLIYDYSLSDATAPFHRPAWRLYSLWLGERPFGEIR